MSQRRTTVPPTRVSSRSPQPGRSGLIAREKNEKQSARERTALDDHFYRTSLRFSGTVPHAKKSGTAMQQVAAPCPLQPRSALLPMSPVDPPSWTAAMAYKSSGVRPVRFAMRASMRGPSSSCS